MYYSAFGPPTDPHSTSAAQAAVALVPDPATKHRLTPELVAQLRAPFKEKVIFVPQCSNVGEGRQVVEPYVPVYAIRQRIEEVLGLDGYREDYAIDGEWVICRLSLGGLTRTGLAMPGDHSVTTADAAFIRAARAFGIALREHTTGWLTAKAEEAVGLAADKHKQLYSDE